MATSDWIPTREQDLVDLMIRWDLWINDATKRTLFGWEEGVCLVLSSKFSQFFDARSAYHANKTPENRLAKEEAKEVAVDGMRDFANESIRFNKRMSDSDRLHMGVHVKDTTYTTHPKPASQPTTEALSTKNHFEHLVRATNRDTGDASKPPDAYGVCFAWQVGGERPANGKDLPKTNFTRKSSCVVEHDEEDKGKTAYYATCYTNDKGERGKWSPVVDAVIG